MAKYVSDTDLSYYHGRINTLFAKQADLDTLDDKVDEIISEGGEPNVIETVKVNGTALVPDAQKAVNVDVPTATSDLTNDGDGTSNFATESYVQLNGGKIDNIAVNGTDQTITNKRVNISVPTTVAELTDASDYVTAAILQGYAVSQDEYENTAVGILINGNTVSGNISDSPTLEVTNLLDAWVGTKGYQTASNVSSSISTALANSGNAYQTASDVSSAISSAVASAYKYKGSVATYADLPASGQTTGDVYDVQADGMNYAWNGSAWDALGQYVDTSLYWAKSELVAMTTAEIDALFA